MDTTERSPVAQHTASVYLHPQTRAAWASAVLFGPAARLRAIAASYTREGLDPDTFVRRYGVAALALLGVRVNVRAYDAHARSEARYQRTWDEIEAVYARREGTALWCEEGIAEVTKRTRERAERERQEAALREARERPRGGASAEERASAWLSYRSGESSDAAYKACVGLVRGFGLDERAAMAMLEAEYVPRYHRAIPRPELLGMVRRASRASKPMGYLLTEERRTG